MLMTMSNLDQPLEDGQDYVETLSSPRTLVLFIMLTVCFGSACGWRTSSVGWDALTVLLAVLAAFFAFYALNYRELTLQLTKAGLTLRFGVFTWRVAATNVGRCYLDDTSLWRVGGAGIHFSPLKGRYRAMFNFLEYPRIVLELRHKQGLVRDIAFSTRHPDRVKAHIQSWISAA